MVPKALSEGTKISIFPQTQTFYTSEFVINATLENGVDVYSWQVQVFFDPSIINCTNAWIPTDSPFNFDVDAPVVINLTEGWVVIGSSKLGDVLGTSGNGTLASIRFQMIDPTSPASFSINFSTSYGVQTFLLNSTLDTIDAETHNGSFEYAIDETEPVIGSPVQFPSSGNVLADQPVEVSVSVTDEGSGVKNVTLIYRNDTTWYQLPMTLNTTTQNWTATIPGHHLGTNITYYIEAYDNAQNHAINNNSTNYYIYTVIPEYPTTLPTIITIATITTITITLKKRKNKNKHAP
jgi:hypothetical protein